MTSRRPAAIQVVETNSDNLLDYIASERDWTNVLTYAGLYDRLREDGGNAPYCVVSIMGPQSSGKSTILNRVFGCDFSTMDSRSGRQQTTTGIWVSNAPRGGDVLVMDLEGTDSMQRTDNRVNFERQTSLFALTMSEVLIINMFANEIGRQSGMNMDTLRSILEANLRLNFPKTRTMLLFLIRDQHPDDNAFNVTPRATLERAVRDHFSEVWMNIDKPDDYKNVPLDELFDVKFYFVAPPGYFPEQFEKDSIDLFRRFTDASYPEYYFNTEYHLRKSMPLEALNDWTRQIWDSISKDENLNIPDQAKLLSAYRCEAAAAAAFQKLVEMLKETVDGMERDGYLTTCGKAVDEAVVEAKRMYELAASKYIREEAQKKLADLMDKIRSFVLSRIFSIQMRALTAHVVEAFEKRLQNSLPRNRCSDNFKQTVMDCTEQARELFRVQFHESCPTTLMSAEEVPRDESGGRSTEAKADADTAEEDRVEASDFARLFDMNLAWEEIGKRLRDVTKTLQGEQYNKLLNVELQQLTDEKLLEPLGKLFSNPPVSKAAVQSASRDETKFEHANPTLGVNPDNPTASRATAAASASQINGFWRDISVLREEFHGRYLTTRIIPKLHGLMFDEDTTRSKTLELRDSTDEIILSKIEAFAHGIEGTAKNVFDRHFSSDPVTRMPRGWTPTSDVEKYFMDARDAVDRLLEIVQVMNVEGNADLGLEPMTRRVLSSEKLGNLGAALEGYMNNQFQNARIAMQGGGGGGTIFPTHPLTWLIFLFFAWNEIWSILTNPIYLFGALFVLIMAFLGFQAQTMSEKLGVDLKSILQASLTKFLKMAMAQLKTVIENFGNDSANNTMKSNGLGNGAPPRGGPAGRRSSVPVNSMSNHGQSDFRQRRVQSEMVSHQDLSGLHVPQKYNHFDNGPTTSNGPPY